MTMITPSYLGETIEYSSLHACRSTLEDPTPNTNGYIAEVNYLPWLNVKLQIQYVGYEKFNGLKLNYDGTGRNASDNNTLYALVWLNY